MTNTDSRFSRHNHLGGFSASCAECYPPAPTTASPEGAAQQIVREWTEHDLDERYNSYYMRTIHCAELEERIATALQAKDEEIARLKERQ